MLALACIHAAFVFGAEMPRPNMVVILSDDMGFSDIGCYGGDIQTPNLDGLAKNGVRFTQFYNTARCCPTRASLLTGLYPHQAGVGHMMENRGLAGYTGRLNRASLTIAEALKPAGYRSYAVGKWHVTPGATANALQDTNNWPLQRGFDRYYGTIHGAGSFYDPSSLVRDNKLITVANDNEYQPKEYYYTEAIAHHAAAFIRDHARSERNKPFFLYVAFTAAHWPLHARPGDIAKYRGRYDGGYEPAREARRKRQNQLGLVPESWGQALPVEDWEKVENKEFERRCMEVYAAQVDSMDQGIGRIVQELKSHGQFENTLILYLQDNGGCAEPIGRGKNPPAREASYKPMAKDELQYNSVPRQTRDGRLVRQGYGVMPGPDDTYIAYGRGWAQVSNTPFREYKHWVHEGGISTPLIAHWPAGIRKERWNLLESQPGHLVDLMATCLDLAGAEYPAEREGRRLKPLQGVSLRPAFAGQPIGRTQPLFWEHEGNRAVREGRWKLVAKENQPWELYDMEADRVELLDLAATNPEKVKELAGKWDEYAARADVPPLGGWRKPEASASNNNNQ
jgi:arylsulfatase